MRRGAQKQLQQHAVLLSHRLEVILMQSYLSEITQKDLRFLGGFRSPPALKISLTKLLESEDVTKKVTINVDKTALIFSIGR